ncbi:hypothetical protein SIAM614_26588 [Stappia aggregata IAM 12614]|uniref:RelA/SpoT domain-containing protein n=1 Tax=Roseibium aggregatum (strain ATCC 25650 / DSM 13394 / JCM 20685 / NBRC 16684 / NCIMB 2208 / IAM 12614 / B1) TaxID=384765 RepID=A0NWS7_ROSAI|nr:hypothetical protein [Roseibium aggregatum]EAV42598.1 hypothetical protein SIAM614_26588 [Stappia aggregata IAM 12614] [Roseibium aggregatum IAM 12614]
MSQITDAENFISKYRQDYMKLLDNIKSTCEQIKNELGIGAIDDVYTRGTSQRGSEFKDPRKIVNKVRQKGLPVGAHGFRELNDIIGLTVVIQYPDQIVEIIKRIRTKLRRNGIKSEKPEEHKNKSGYYATHVVCFSSFDAIVLRCEIQFKTMLHDAWAAKMHDLTYKPSGMLDPRLNSLMASIANTVENLEQQSILIRDLIKTGWDVEGEARRAARHNLFGTMLAYTSQALPEEEDEKIKKLHAEIEAASETINKKPTSNKQITKLTNAVEECCQDKNKVRQGWLMAGRIASMRNEPDLSRFLQNQVERLLDFAPELLKSSSILPKEIAAIPLMFYVIGDLDTAIDFSERLQKDKNYEEFPDDIRMMMITNCASFMTEREYHSPTADEEIRNKTKKEIEKALCDGFSYYKIESEPDAYSSILDTQGLMKITFAKTMDEVRQGIEDCIQAKDLSTPDEKQLSHAYMDLNLKLGWRRYFELETLKT